MTKADSDKLLNLAADLVVILRSYNIRFPAYNADTNKYVGEGTLGELEQHILKLRKTYASNEI